MLRKLECFLRPSAVDELRDDLIKAGIEGMSVSHVEGFGRQRGHLQGEAPSPDVRLLPKLKLEIVVEEDLVDRIVQVILRHGQTGAIGAGKVFIIPVEDAIRVGTGERGHSAIR
jgi:nitrogen regulatory protein P-II 1